MQLQKPSPATLKADRYGRVMVDVAINKKVVGEVIAPGYRPTAIDVVCSSVGKPFEQTMTLELDSKQ